MTMLTAVERRAGMSNEAVKKKTGNTWPQWYTIIDKAGGKEMTHQQIVALLRAKHGVGSWWRQMVTVAYERERGKRTKHETPRGFQISATKTIAGPVRELYRAWKKPRGRAAWLGRNRMMIRRAAANKTLRMTWADGTSSVEVYFSPKGKNKTQVTVQHNKLSSAANASRMKKYWARKLGILQSSIEKRSGANQ